MVRALGFGMVSGLLYDFPLLGWGKRGINTRFGLLRRIPLPGDIPLPRDVRYWIVAFW